MDFKKYNSIENSYRSKIVNKIKEKFPNEKFIVQEKIHGSCFSIFINRDKIICAKRSGFISNGDNFYNHQNAIDPFEMNFRALFLYCSSILKIENMCIRCELFGGSYPHGEVGVRYGATRIQKGVFYTSDNTIIAFDLELDGKIVDMDQFELLCSTYGIPHTKRLLTGTLDKCLSYPNAFQTTIPKLLGHPEIADNICEGVVIKPVTPLFFGNGKRVILKNKNEKFTEKTKSKERKSDIILSESAKLLLAEMLSLVNKNRLDCVLSKGDIFTKDSFGVLLGLMSKDVREEFNKDHINEFTQLVKSEQKILNKTLNREISNLIRPDWLNIIDGSI